MSVCLLGLTLYPVSDAAANRQVAESVAIPLYTSLETIDQQDASHEAPESSLTWREQKVTSGDSLSTLFSRASFSPTDVHRITSSKDGKLLLDIYPGEILRFGSNSNGELEELHYIQSKLVSI